MAKLSALRVDPELSEEGRWVDYELGIRLRIARHNNSRYQAYFMKLMRNNPEVQEDTEVFQNLLKVAVLIVYVELQLRWSFYQDL